MGVVLKSPIKPRERKNKSNLPQISKNAKPKKVSTTELESHMPSPKKSRKGTLASVIGSLLILCSTAQANQKTTFTKGTFLTNAQVENYTCPADKAYKFAPSEGGTITRYCCPRSSALSECDSKGELVCKEGKWEVIVNGKNSGQKCI